MFELAFFSPPDMLLVMVVALIVFGPKRLPEVGRQVGQFLREGRKMMSSFTDAMNDDHVEVSSPVRDQSVPGEVVRGASSTPTAATPAPQLTLSASAEAPKTEAEHETESEKAD